MGTVCAHHLNSINLIRQEISSPNCLSSRWTWPNSIWRESMMAALISQVSSNQKEKWKNNVNIISSYNGPINLLSWLHRALNTSNVLWGKSFIQIIQTFIGFPLRARHSLGNGDVVGATPTKIPAFMSLLGDGDRQILWIKIGSAEVGVWEEGWNFKLGWWVGEAQKRTHWDYTTWTQVDGIKVCTGCIVFAKKSLNSIQVWFTLGAAYKHFRIHTLGVG